MNILFRNTKNDYVIYENEIFRYIGKRKIFKKYNRINLLNENTMRKAINSGFSTVKTSSYDKNKDCVVYSYFQIDIKYVEDSKEEYLYLEKELNLLEINSFYQPK